MSTTADQATKHSPSNSGGCSTAVLTPLRWEECPGAEGSAVTLIGRYYVGRGIYYLGEGFTKQQNGWHWDYRGPLTGKEPTARSCESYQDGKHRCSEDYEKRVRGLFVCGD